MTTIKTTVALMALAAGVAACGTTATAKASPTTTAGPTTAPTVDCGHPNTPPKNMPPKPVADNCWAGGFWLGQGSFHNRKLIFVDKSAIYGLYKITSQLLRSNPQAASTVETATDQFLTPSAQEQIRPVIAAEAKDGYRLVSTGTNPKDPTGLVYTYPIILSGGVSDIPDGQPTQTFPVNSRASVGECVDMQMYAVDANGSHVSGINGKTGYRQWTDELVKTSNGWKVSYLYGGLAVKPC